MRRQGITPALSAIAKNHVDVKLENCVFYDNEISLRLRGPDGAGELGGAWVAAEKCVFYATDVAIRLEDRIEKWQILGPLYGSDVNERVTAFGRVSASVIVTGIRIVSAASDNGRSRIHTGPQLAQGPMLKPSLIRSASKRVPPKTR
jgi:hypothetical protein